MGTKPAPNPHRTSKQFRLRRPKDLKADDALNQIHDIDETKVFTGIRTQAGYQLYERLVKEQSKDNKVKVAPKKIAVAWNAEVDILIAAADSESAKSRIRKEYGYVSQAQAWRFNQRVELRIEQTELFEPLAEGLKGMYGEILNREVAELPPPQPEPDPEPHSSARSEAARPAAIVHNDGQRLAVRLSDRQNGYIFSKGGFSSARSARINKATRRLAPARPSTQMIRLKATAQQIHVANISECNGDDNFTFPVSAECVSRWGMAIGVGWGGSTPKGGRIRVGDLSTMFTPELWARYKSCNCGF